MKVYYVLSDCEGTTRFQDYWLHEFLRLPSLHGPHFQRGLLSECRLSLTVDRNASKSPPDQLPLNGPHWNFHLLPEQWSRLYSHPRFWMMTSGTPPG